MTESNKTKHDYKGNTQSIQKNKVTLSPEIATLSASDLINKLLSGFINRMEGADIILENESQILDLIIKENNAVQYIGVGVGGFYINKDKKVLVYLRKKEPEKGKWTLIGGKHELDVEQLKYKNLKTRLIEKFQQKANVIDNGNIEIKEVLKVVDHFDDHNINRKPLNYYYLSPAFHVDISNGDELFKDVEKISKNQLKRKIDISKYIGEYPLRFVDVDLIVDKDTQEQFTKTARDATTAYLNLQSNIQHLYEHIDNIKYIKLKEWGK